MRSAFHGINLSQHDGPNARLVVGGKKREEVTAQPLPAPETSRTIAPLTLDGKPSRG